MTGTPSDIAALADIIVRTIRSRGRVVDVTAEEAIRDALSALVPEIEKRAVAAYKEDFMHAPWRTEDKP